MKIDCLYKIEGAKFLTVRNFGDFYYILGTTDTLEVIQLLELAVRLRKRAARLALSYKIGTSNSTNTRERISAEHSDLNTVGSDDDDEATQLARRNSKLQVPIQQQPNCRAAPPEGKVSCSYSTGCTYSRYLCLKAGRPCNTRCKHKEKACNNVYGTALERPITAALVLRTIAALRAFAALRAQASAPTTTRGNADL